MQFVFAGCNWSDASGSTTGAPPPILSTVRVVNPEGLRTSSLRPVLKCCASWQNAITDRRASAKQLHLLVVDNENSSSVHQCGEVLCVVCSPTVLPSENAFHAYTSFSLDKGHVWRSCNPFPGHLRCPTHIKSSCQTRATWL